VVTRLISAPPIDFSDLRRELRLPSGYPAPALAEAEAAAAQVSVSAVGVPAGPGHVDRTDIPFVTIDPATSRDLDQAVSIHRLGSGYRVFYAIADVTAFVALGGALEAETWVRGQTVYLPDGNVPLHPPRLCEDAASLLPDAIRPAVLWTLDLDSAGMLTDARVGRAVVRSRAKLDYIGVQASVDQGTLLSPIALLPEVGKLLVQRALDRGAINLPIPEQEVELEPGGDWRLTRRRTTPVEVWNSQISLLTGAAAASMMLHGGVGLLRTMPQPQPAAVARLRRAGQALGIDWPDGVTVGRVIDGLDPAQPRAAAFIDHAAELLRGAGYTAFEGTAPPDPGHGGVGGPYAHVTAPLRRLADRYSAEVCMCLTAGLPVPEWVRAALPKLPAVMESTDHRASAAQRGAVDLAEAVLLRGRVGEEFDATVIDVDSGSARSDHGSDNHGSDPQGSDNHGRGDHETRRPPGGVVVVEVPPVRARCSGPLQLGERIRVRLVAADPSRRLVSFTAV
jgi:exoribonuclease R